MTEIERWNKQPYVQRIRQKMESFKPLYADMTPAAGIDYNSIIVRSAPNFFISCRGQFQQLDMSIEISPEAMKRYPNIVILHELIHLHESLLSDAEAEDVQRKLESKLSGEIPNLKIIMQERETLMQVINPRFDYIARLAHDDLFFLKSLDIDLCFPRKYKLGRIGDYRFDWAIELLQAMIASGTLEKQKENGYAAFEVA